MVGKKEGNYTRILPASANFFAWRKLGRAEWKTGEDGRERVGAGGWQVGAGESGAGKRLPEEDAKTPAPRLAVKIS